MIRKGDKLHTHLEGSFTVVEAPRVWSRTGQIVLQSDRTGEQRTTKLSALLSALQNNYYQHEAVHLMSQRVPNTVLGIVLTILGCVLLYWTPTLVDEIRDGHPEQLPEVVEMVQEAPKNSACGIAEPWQKISTPVDGYRCFAYKFKTGSGAGGLGGVITKTAGVACFPEEEVDTALLEACK